MRRMGWMGVCQVRDKDKWVPNLFFLHGSQDDMGQDNHFMLVRWSHCGAGQTVLNVLSEDVLLASNMSEIVTCTMAMGSPFFFPLCARVDLGAIVDVIAENNFNSFS